MICPECGKETSNEQAFCRQCGAYVRSQFGKVLPTGPLRPVRSATTGPLVARVEKDSLAELDWAEIEDLLLAENDEWPAEESVFVPNDEAADDGADSVEANFDDAQADDQIEQSLSGQIKREEILLTPEPTFQQTLPSIHTTRTDVDLATVPPATYDHFLKTNPDMFAGVEPATAPPPTIIKTPRNWATLAMISLIPLVFFAGGLALGVRTSEYFEIEIPSPSAVEPVALEPVRPLPPQGMVFVPGGDFLMGSDEGDTISKPPHFVSVKPFFMDLTEVTNRQYAEFIDATGQVPPASWKDGVYPEAEADHPVTGVNWYEAAEYAAWKGKRLPTEAEWEFAARGTDGRRYPWGDEWDPALANAGGESKGTRIVGKGGASPFGIYDMAGNAWEWTSSDARPYPGGKEFPWSRLRLKIIRGGSWESNERSSTTYFRGYYGADGEKDYSGTTFRCVKDLAK